MSAAPPARRTPHLVLQPASPGPGAGGGDLWRVTDHAGESLGTVALTREPDRGVRLAWSLRTTDALTVEAVREAVAFVYDQRPGEPVTAVGDTELARVAERVGLVPVAPDDGGLVRCVGPTIEVADPTVLREELLDLWDRVNAAGGAVGFAGRAPREHVAARYDKHAATADRLVVLRDPHGRLGGMGFWTYGTPPAHHTGLLQRLMVEPTWQGRNTGRILLAGAHAVARADGIEVARLTVRGGTGLERFYERAGYRTYARLPHALRFTEPDGTQRYYAELGLAAELVDLPPE